MMPVFDKVIDGKATTLVWKKVLRPGVGEKLTPKAAILYHYEAYLDGVDEPFDSTILRGKPQLHRLNGDSIIRGLYLGLLEMRKLEKSHIIIRPEVGFGAMGCPPRIPGKATILYIVEILNTFEEGSLANFETLPYEEQQNFSFNQILEMCDDERKSGNSYFCEKRFKDASFRYRRAIRILENRVFNDGEEERQAQVILLKVYVNQANVTNKLQKHFASMGYCKKALAIDQKNVKALYHYGNAKFLAGDYDEAKDYLLRANRIEPGNPSVADLMIKLEQRLKREHMKETDMYTKMGSLFK
jgi:FK506-binding protein 6